MAAARKTESGGGVVINSRGDVLVVSQHGDSWSLPKGHVEPGEDALAAARREIQEETGVSSLVLLKQLPSYARYRIGKGGEGEDRSELKTIRMFLFKTAAREPLLPADPDNPEARFVPKGEVAALLTHPKDKEFFRNILREL